MRSVINHNVRTTVTQEKKSKKKYEELRKRKQKFGDRKHSFHRSDERLTKRRKKHDK